jgi:protein TonB
VFTASISASQEPSRGRRIALAGSIALHALLIAALVYRPPAKFVLVHPLKHGVQGTSLTEIYLPGTSDGSGRAKIAYATESEQSEGSVAAKTALRYQKKKQRAGASLGTAENALVAAMFRAHESKQSGGAPAGSVYGSSSYGELEGHDVRPALPIAGSNPHASSADLDGKAEGNVVVEVAIDTDGNIVNTKVLQSLGAEVDTRVLMALRDWRFRPATRDGQPIPSLQDVVFHFPS